VTDQPPRLPTAWLSPLAASVDRVLARHGYDIAATTDAFDDAVPGDGGLFDPATTTAELRAAAERLGDTAPSPVPSPVPALDGATAVCYTDGGSRGNPGPAGAGAVVATAAGDTAVRVGRPVGSRTDANVAEYAALHLGLDRLLACCTPSAVEVRSDSRTVIDDVWGDGEPTVDGVTRYRERIAALLATVPDHRVVHLADHEPNPADALATVGADIAALGPGG
jgi:ribonuclease HI